MSELRDFDRANELQVEVQKITISELQKRIAELEGVANWIADLHLPGDFGGTAVHVTREHIERARKALKGGGE